MEPQSPALPLAEPEPYRDPKAMGILELLLVLIGLGVLMAGEIFINKPKLFFDGPLLLDECLTDSIVRDPSIASSIHAVQHGVDTNPPVYHLILRGFWMGVHELFPHASPRIGLRGFSMVCTWLALVCVYGMVRKGFSKFAALVAVLAVWAHPVVVEQSADARFYAPLLLASVVMCLALQIRGKGIIRGIFVALCAILLCTLHYFGVLMLGPIVLAMLLVDEAGFGSRIVRVLPAIVGPLALLPFLTFIKTQHEGISVKTWIDPFSFHTARDFATDVLSPLPLVIAVGIWALGRLMQRTPSGAFDTVALDPQITPEMIRRRLRFATGPMLSLILVPLIIIGFSAVVQSALIPRYAIAATLPLGAFVALLAKNRSSALLFILSILLTGFTVLELHSVSASRAGDLRELSGWRDELVNEQPPLPMVFADRAAATQLAAFAPDLLPRISILDQRQPGVELTNFRTYEIEMVDKVNPFYPTPALIPLAQMAAMGKFHLIAPQDMQTILLELPLRRVGGDVYEPLK